MPVAAVEQHDGPHRVGKRLVEVQADGLVELAAVAVLRRRQPRDPARTRRRPRPVAVRQVEQGRLSRSMSGSLMRCPDRWMCGGAHRLARHPGAAAAAIGTAMPHVGWYRGARAGRVGGAPGPLAARAYGRASSSVGLRSSRCFATVPHGVLVLAEPSRRSTSPITFARLSPCSPPPAPRPGTSSSGGPRPPNHQASPRVGVERGRSAWSTSPRVAHHRRGGQVAAPSTAAAAALRRAFARDEQPHARPGPR